MNRLMRSIKAGKPGTAVLGLRDRQPVLPPSPAPAAFARFATEIDAILSDPALGPLGKLAALAGDHPDVFVTIALGAVVLLAPPLKGLIARAGRPAAVNAFDVVGACCRGGDPAVSRCAPTPAG